MRKHTNFLLCFLAVLACIPSVAAAVPQQRNATPRRGKSAKTQSTPDSTFIVRTFKNVNTFDIQLAITDAGGQSIQCWKSLFRDLRGRLTGGTGFLNGSLLSAGSKVTVFIPKQTSSVPFRFEATRWMAADNLPALEGTFTDDGVSNLKFNVRRIRRTFVNRTRLDVDVVTDREVFLPAIGYFRVYVEAGTSKTLDIDDIPNDKGVSFTVKSRPFITLRESGLHAFEFTGKVYDDGTTIITEDGIIAEPASLETGKRAPSISPDEAGDKELDVDRELDRMARQGGSSPLPLSTDVPLQGDGWEGVVVKNDTRYALKLFYSGPVKTSIIIPPGQSATINIPPGTYRIGVQAQGSNIRGLYGQRTFHKGTRPETTYFIKSTIRQ